MKLQPFLLDQWLNQYHFSDPPIEYDLASSTGPAWTVGEVMDLLGEDERRRLSEAKLVYTSAAGGESLREEIARMQGVEAAQVQVVTGASEALLILFFLAAEPGANVIVPSPAFPTIAALPRSFGLETRLYHLRPENSYRVDLDEIKALTDDRTKIIFVNSPHNPTGATLSDGEIDALHDFAAERGIQFVVDEVYHPIYHGSETASAARLERATVLGDFSKALCLSGLRVGWVVERDAARMEKYRDCRSYFTISNTPVGEALAEAATRNRDLIFERARRASSANLERLDRFFAEHKEMFGWVRPRGGMTAFPWLKAGGSARGFCEALAGRGGVLLAPGDCFEMPAHFRLGFGVIGERLPQALERLGDFIKHYSTQAA